MKPLFLVPVLLAAAVLPTTTVAGNASEPSHARLAAVRLLAPPPRPDGAGASLPSFAGRAPIDRVQAPAYPTYAWPLERTPRNDVVYGNHVDHDPLSTGILDYMGGAWTYDGHRGFDIGLPDFRDMDRGVAVKAAAPGVVEYIDASTFDRGCEGSPVDNGNTVVVANGDGSSTFYFHLRAHSRTVELGDAVQTGQTLGLVGSSGFSFGPHLHFEAGDWFGMGYTARDPFNGPQNPLPSLWASQPPYPPTQPFWVGRINVTTTNALGDENYCSVFLERPDEAVVIGLAEPFVHFTFPIQCGPAETLHVELRRPNDTVYAGFDSPWNDDVLGGVAWYSFFWNGNVPPADSGLWTFRASSDGVVRGQKTFRVGATTVYAPRVAAPAGRSFRIDGTTQHDTLRRSPRSAPLTWSLLGAPAFVTLAQDSIVTVGGASTQTHRSLFFQVVGADAAGRRDTAWYHVVDPTKPFNPIVGAEPPAAGAHAVAFATAWPNPSSGTAVLTFALPARARVRLAIHDLSGRLVRVVAEGAFEAATSHRVAWDGRDDHGATVPSGVYFARLESRLGVATARLVRVR